MVQIIEPIDSCTVRRPQVMMGINDALLGVDDVLDDLIKPVLCSGLHDVPYE